MHVTSMAHLINIASSKRWKISSTQGEKEKPLTSATHTQNHSVRPNNRVIPLRWSTGPKLPLSKFAVVHSIMISRGNSWLLSAVSDPFIFDFQSYPPYCDDPIQFCFRRRTISCGQPLFTKTHISDLCFFCTFILYILEADFAPCLSFSRLLCILLDWHQPREYLLIPRRNDENKFIHSLNGFVQRPLF